MSNPHRIGKVKKKRKCRMWDCKKTLEKGQQMLEEYGMCLNCAEKQLIRWRKQNKESISNIDKSLRTIKRYPKERIVQRLS